MIRLISSHQGMLYAYILTMHPNRVAAQDILQETNLSIWKKAATFQLGTNFKAWAFKVAYFQTLAHLQREKRRGWEAFDEELAALIHEESASYLDHFETRHLALKDCLAKIPSSDIQILRLFYEQNFGLEKIGGLLGRSVGALKQVLLRLRRTLRTCIERTSISSAPKLT